jgi:hypothetical protein
MSVNQFMKTNLAVIRDEIIKNIPSNNFNSHEFIRNFAKKFEIEYVGFLNTYSTEPFRTVHAQIGLFLSEHQELLHIKHFDPTHQSPNIFGIETKNGNWIKTA